ncbi:MAG: 16S rRNA (uracil(1498)-N(3))-methyltransferase [Clostridia bacterium]|nr:16S rRNA (uracil(1498)-N(3))-methyltransferase [Clostridia bacterium]
MPRFFVRQDAIAEGEILLRGEDAHHIARSLRMAVGDGVTVCDMQGNEYDCSILSFLEDAEVRVKILSTRHAENEPPCRIVLFQALPKGDKLDTVIQKAVECGATEIVPFESERCVVRMKPEAEEKKTERRQRIATEAAKQCGRSVIPKVERTVKFDEMLNLASACELGLFCYEGDGTIPLGELLREKKATLTSSSVPSVAVIIGSEGGFSLAEVERARARDLYPVGLGKRILRTETASGFVLACLSFVTELGG